MAATSRIRDIFAQSVALPRAERLAFVGAACEGDGELREAIESLLKAHEEAGDFLSDPAIDTGRFVAGPAQAGTRIGPYTILKVIGEGGHGIVYLAGQETPVRRQVALKVIKPGMDSRPIIARFEAERQALALMEHSNIARVLDAGTSESGHPYFVMEHVDGPSITAFSEGLSLPARLELFAKVCLAVQHAHQKGIIHRDLKPANILVTMQDGVPTPKIIDFGIAKILQEEENAGRTMTGQGQFLGTPQYMSPEQAGAARDIDTRADIYALGAVLYEMLTGLPAFEAADLRAAAGAEMDRIIREVDPPWPSARLRSLGAKTESAPASRAFYKSSQRVRGELDWIVMKAMEKDRERRYGTAERLARDVLNYLADEPVAAGPPSRMYRFSKFARRNRALMTSVGAVILSLAAGLGVSIYAFLRAENERAAAQAARAQAQEQRADALKNEAKAEGQAAKLLEVQSFLFRLLAPSDASQPRAVLDFAAQRIGDQAYADHPEVQAPVRAALGMSYLKDRSYAEAEAQFRGAIEALERSGAGDGLEIASDLNNAGWAIILQGRFDDAEPLIRRSLAIYRRLLPGDNNVDAPVLQNLAMIEAKRGKLDEAEQLVEAAIGYFRRAGQASSLPEALDQLADILEQEKRHDEAAGKRAEAEEARRRLKQKSVAEDKK